MISKKGFCDWEVYSRPVFKLHRHSQKFFCYCINIWIWIRHMRLFDKIELSLCRDFVRLFSRFFQGRSCFLWRPSLKLNDFMGSNQTALHIQIRGKKTVSLTFAKKSTIEPTRDYSDDAINKAWPLTREDDVVEKLERQIFTDIISTLFGQHFQR